ncbi:MAG: YqhA family protein, partial [Sulfuriferula sp.]
MRFIESMFEAALWRSRYMVVFAVVASMASALMIMYMATVDVVYLVQHVMHYADSSLAAEARKAIHDETITHVVEVVDGYLLSTFMLIFSLGLYELFVSDIDEAHGQRTSSKILVINSLDDLKQRLAKVVLMILIVSLFEKALKIPMTQPLDLLYLGAAIALIGVALYFTHASEAHGSSKEDAE